MNREIDPIDEYLHVFQERLLLAARAEREAMQAKFIAGAVEPVEDSAALNTQVAELRRREEQLWQTISSDAGLERALYSPVSYEAKVFRRLKYLDRLQAVSGGDDQRDAAHSDMGRIHQLRLSPKERIVNAEIRRDLSRDE